MIEPGQMPCTPFHTIAGPEGEGELRDAQGEGGLRAAVRSRGMLVAHPASVRLLARESGRGCLPARVRGMVCGAGCNWPSPRSQFCQL